MIHITTRLRYTVVHEVHQKNTLIGDGTAKCVLVREARKLCSLFCFVHLYVAMIFSSLTGCLDTGAARPMSNI